MISKKIFSIVVIIMALTIAFLLAIIFLPFSGGSAVETPEEAILIAKAALVQKYRDESYMQLKLFAVLDLGREGYWYVGEGNKLGQAPHVLVRQRDGKVILEWE